MSDFFDDNPFNDANKDDPFASGNAPGSDNPFADSSGLGDLGGDDDLGIPSFGDTSADMPENLVTPPRPTPSRNRGFVIGLALLAVVMVVGLGVILFAAIQNNAVQIAYLATSSKIAQQNNDVLTALAATTTAKSWTLTPSHTPIPTDTPTPTLTNTPIPTNTTVPSNTPIPTITNTFPPDVTPPTATATPVPITIVAPNQDALNTQSAALKAAVTAFSAQETANAHAGGDTKPTKAAKQTQAAEFGAAQTGIAVQLTAYAQSAGGGNGSNQTTTPTPNQVATICDLSPTPTPGSGPSVTPTNCITPTPTPSATILASGARFGSGQLAVLYINNPQSQAQVQDTAEPTAPVNTPSQIQGAAPATLSGTLIAATATTQYLNNQNQTLIAAQSALGMQLTLNAMTATPQETENAQLDLGLTAIAVQLNANAAAEGTLVAIVQKLPTSGLYEDLAGGKASPGSLALVGVAAIGLVGVIVAARRLRVK
ncbi:MAG: hypothetical protein ACYDBJ_11260 [Aggregatilineales bacterium]